MGHCLGNYCKSFRVRRVRRSRSGPLGVGGGCQWGSDRRMGTRGLLMVRKCGLDQIRFGCPLFTAEPEAVARMDAGLLGKAPEGRRGLSFLARFHEASGRKGTRPSSSRRERCTCQLYTRAATVCIDCAEPEHSARPRRNAPCLLALPPDGGSCNRCNSSRLQPTS